MRLIHWNAAEAKPLIALLRKAGHTVLHEATSASGTFTRWKAEMPDALVIDLSRLPSHGREVAVGFRAAKATRHIPLIFVEGAPEKVAALRDLLPDATYSEWPKAAAVIEQALQKRVVASAGATKAANPVVPTPMMNRYVGRSLAQKLGIGEDAEVCLFDAPRDWHTFLEPLPEAATVAEGSLHAPRNQAEGASGHACDVAVCFFREAASFHAAVPALLRLAQPAMRGTSRGKAFPVKTKLWIAWPKRTSLLFRDLSENTIRDAILAIGLVDYKVCAISSTWSGIAVAVKK